MNTELKNYISTFKHLKGEGVPKDEAMDALEFDSDEYPDYGLLRMALDEVYGKDEAYQDPDAKYQSFVDSQNE